MYHAHRTRAFSDIFLYWSIFLSMVAYNSACTFNRMSYGMHYQGWGIITGCKWISSDIIWLSDSVTAEGSLFNRWYLPWGIITKVIKWDVLWFVLTGPSINTVGFVRSSSCYILSCYFDDHAWQSPFLFNLMTNFMLKCCIIAFYVTYSNLVSYRI